MKILPAEFDGQAIRRTYDEASDAWRFSVTDVVQVLTGSANASLFAPEAQAAATGQRAASVRENRTVETAGHRPDPDIAARASLCHHAAMSTPSAPITIDPQRRGGRACVRDLRISVGDVLGWLAGGMTPEQVLADYPELTLDDIRACLAYAAAREAHELRLPAAA